MLKKKKLCDGPCGEFQFIWKNHGGKRYCRQCWSAHSSNSRPKPTVSSKPLPPRSPARSKEERIYTARRIIFLAKHPMCHAHLPGCTGRSTDVHHTYSGKDREAHFLDEETWLPICRRCHDWIHTHSKAARELGYLK